MEKEQQSDFKLIGVSLVKDPPPGCEIKTGSIDLAPKTEPVDLIPSSPKAFKTKKSREFFEGCLISSQFMAKKLSEDSETNVHYLECIEMHEFILKCTVGFGDQVLKDPQFPWKHYLAPARIVAITEIILSSRGHFLNLQGIDKRKFELEWRKVRSALKNWEMEF